MAEISADELKTAFSVKRRIEQVILSERVLGTCPYFAESESEDEHESDEENEAEPSRSTKDLTRIRHALWTFECKQFYIDSIAFDDHAIVIQDGDKKDVYAGKLCDLNNTEQVIKLFAVAAQSPYGNVETLENETKLEVRDAKEFVHFTLDPAFVRTLQAQVDTYVAGASVLPYKLNIYGPGGHFAKHKDTPEQGLIGTLLVGLHQSEDSKYKHLKVCEASWTAHAEHALFFYPDQVHEVVKTQGYRMTLACKVFVSALQPRSLVAPLTPAMTRLAIALDEAKKTGSLQEPFGFLMNHEYSITELSAWKGNDAHILGTLEHLGYRFVMQPVIVHHTYIGDVEGGDGAIHETAVHPIAPVKQELQDVTTCTFFNAISNETKWSSEEDEGAEYTGNEARPASEDSVYVQFAVVVLDKSTKKQKPNSPPTP